MHRGDDMANGKLIDKKTGRELHSGDVLIRKDYKGFTHRYELYSISEDNSRVQVRELGSNDAWQYYSMPIGKLGLDWVMV
jgi:hypothetical protein